MYYQLKSIRKKEKTATYRIFSVPGDITFAQLALIMEEILQYPKTDLYEFEFFDEKYRIRELPDEFELPPHTKYNYLHAPDTYINYWLDTQPWFTFRILDASTGRRDPSLPEYRTEFMDTCDSILNIKANVKIHHPLLAKSRRLENDPYWSDDEQINSILKTLYEFHTSEAEYPNFDQLLDSVLVQKAGITISRKPADRETRNIESPDARLERRTDQLNRDLVTEINKVIDEYYEKDGDRYRLKVPEEEFQKALEKAETEIAANLSGEFEEYLNDFSGIQLPEGFNLTDMLMSYSKNELITEAHDFDLQIDEKKKKEDIAAEIADFLLDPEQMEKLLLFVSAEELDAFEKVLKSGLYKPTAEEEVLLDQFYAMDYLAAYESGKCSVPDDVTTVYLQLLEKDYRAYHSVASWLLFCLRAFDLILGFAPIRVLYSMFRKGKPEDFTYDDFLELLNTFPEDINPCVVSDDTVMSALLLETGMYDVLSAEQQDVMYYIPSTEEIKSYGKDRYPSRDTAYRELYRWMGEEFGQDEKDCEFFCTTACRIFSMGANPTDFLREMTDRDLGFQSKEQLEKTIDLLNRVLGHTRQARLRGHTTDEITKMTNRRPVKSTLSGNSAGEILKMPETPLNAAEIAAGPGTFHSEVIPVDFTAGQVQDPAGREKKKKIGPNDPCPCGSGKKYKKCCGRNRGF